MTVSFRRHQLLSRLRRLESGPFRVLGINRAGQANRIVEADILVVSPYNIQVNLLKSVLPDGAKVGTVDKFQGQEAAVVLISMTASSAEDIPRS